MGNDTVKRFLLVSFSLSIFCSVLVCGSAISLKDRQQTNKALDIKRNLLISSGVIDSSVTSKDKILKAYERVTELAVEINTGELNKDVDTANLDARKLAKTPGSNIVLDSSDDLAKIKTISKISKVYLVK